MTSLPLTPTTELEAVGLLMLAIGETPVTSLTALTGDAAAARILLHETSRNLQDRGWSFNSDDALVLSPNANGEVRLPANTARVDIAAPVPFEDSRVIFRGPRAYDRAAHTYQLSRPLKVDLVTFLPWEELPHYARRLIIARAVVRFIMSIMPAAETLSMWRGELEHAEVAFSEAEIDVEDPNAFLSDEMLARTNRRI